MWAYPTGNVDLSSVIEEIQIIGNSSILSHLIVSNPTIFVCVVLLPIVKSLSCFHPVQCLLKSVRYREWSVEDSFGMIIDYLSPYVFSSTGLAMHVILDSMSSKDTDKDKDDVKGNINQQKNRIKSSAHSTSADSNRSKSNNNDEQKEALEYMFYYIQKHRKDTLSRSLNYSTDVQDDSASNNKSSSGTESRIYDLENDNDDDNENDNDDDNDDGRKKLKNKTNKNIKRKQINPDDSLMMNQSTTSSDTIRTGGRVIWFSSLDSLTDRDPAVLYKILVSEHVQR